MLSAFPVFFEKFDLLHDGKLNNAAAVLFGRDFYFYPQCLLRMARFKGTIKDEFIDNQRVTGNIYTLLDAAMSFFFKHLSLSGNLPLIIDTPNHGNSKRNQNHNSDHNDQPQQISTHGNPPFPYASELYLSSA